MKHNDLQISFELKAQMLLGVKDLFVRHLNHTF